MKIRQFKIGHDEPNRTLKLLKKFLEIACSFYTKEKLTEEEIFELVNSFFVTEMVALHVDSIGLRRLFDRIVHEFAKVEFQEEYNKIIGKK